MSISIEILPSRHHAIQLTVRQDGLNVEVEKGPFTFMDEETVLPDDFMYTAVPDAEYDVSVMGYLARPKGGGDALVVVDEVVQDGVDQPSMWTEHDPIRCIFRTIVHPGATDLDVNVTYYEMPRPGRGTA